MMIHLTLSSLPFLLVLFSASVFLFLDVCAHPVLVWPYFNCPFLPTSWLVFDSRLNFLAFISNQHHNLASQTVEASACDWTGARFFGNSVNKRISAVLHFLGFPNKLVWGSLHENVNGPEMLADNVFSHSVTPKNYFHDDRLR